jgi:hypothetical protein
VLVYLLDLPIDHGDPPFTIALLPQFFIYLFSWAKRGVEGLEYMFLICIIHPKKYIYSLPAIKILFIQMVLDNS